MVTILSVQRDPALRFQSHRDAGGGGGGGGGGGTRALGKGRGASGGGEDLIASVALVDVGSQVRADARVCIDLDVQV